MNSIELLSPAKNLDFGIEAINSGADAVYIAAENFGARKNASNSIDDIELLVKHAHKYNVKVYVVINTIIYDEEIEQVKRLINQIYSIGADAIIIQDTGILEMNLPPIPIFASTQMHNHSVEKIKFLQDVGFQRVILARELSLSQIQEIKNNTSIELETFIHGAICVSYSGQCYISQYLTGRSGNRGECAQICRTPFSLIDSENNLIHSNSHLLSVKDFNASKHIEKLIDIGVKSFKIEGRLKDLAYVKNTTSYYRNLIDKISENKHVTKSSSGKSIHFFTPDLSKTFNRQYSEYFLNDEREKIANFKTPKSIGEEIGKIIDSKDGFYIAELNTNLNNGDGICFFNKNEIDGFYINKVDGQKIYPDNFQKIEPDTIIYRNFNHDFQKTILSKPSIRKINATATIDKLDEKLILSIIDEDNNKTETLIDSQLELANNTEKALENIKTQISKSGNTIFDITKVEYNCNEVYFIQTSVLNQARRYALENLESIRLDNYKRTEFKIIPNNISFPEKSNDYSLNISNKLAANFYKRHGINFKELAVEKDQKYDNIKLMTTKYCLKFELGLCEKHQNPEKKYNQLYLRNFNNKFTLEFNCKECVMYVKNS